MMMIKTTMMMMMMMMPQQHHLSNQSLFTLTILSHRYSTMTDAMMVVLTTHKNFMHPLAATIFQ